MALPNRDQVTEVLRSVIDPELRRSIVDLGMVRSVAIADDGRVDGDDSGTGLSIVRALVRDELQGTFDLRSDGGTRAEVVFPA